MAPEVEGLPGLRATLPRTAAGRQLLLWRLRAAGSNGWDLRAATLPFSPAEGRSLPWSGEPGDRPAREDCAIGRSVRDPWSVRRTGELCGTPAARPRSRPTACGCRSAIERASPISPIHHSRLPSRESRSAWKAEAVVPAWETRSPVVGSYRCAHRCGAGSVGWEGRQPT